MVKPTSESVDLARGMMNEENPLIMYVAVIIGRTMELNHRCVRDILDELRGEFVAAGTGEVFEKLEDRLDGVFRDFFNKEDEP
jgi:hypothetical protein